MLQFILGFRTFMNIKRGNGYNVEYNSDRRIWRGRKMKEKSKDLVEISKRMDKAPKYIKQMWEKYLPQMRMESI